MCVFFFLFAFFPFVYLSTVEYLYDLMECEFLSLALFDFVHFVFSLVWVVRIVLVSGDNDLILYG